MKARATLASVVVMLALTAAAVSLVASPAFAVASACGGTQGQPLLLGCLNNTATDATILLSSGPSGLDVTDTSSDGVGVYGNGDFAGIYGQGNTRGVYGVGGTYGVLGTSSTSYGVYGTTASSSTPAIYGTSTGGGDGIQGLTAGATASAVYGKNTSGGGPVAKGVFGTATGGGTGVRGESSNGNGVEGVSSTGTGVYASGGAVGLEVVGKAKFSRSGVVTVLAGKASMTVTLAGVTTSSMVLATAQQSKAVYVKAVVPAAGSFKIFLTGNAPTGGLKVAYFVLN